MKEAISVTQLNRYIKELVSDDRILSNVLVKGEISNLKESKGNYYFVLKDESSSISCIVFTHYSGAQVNINELCDGQEFIIEGKVAVYEKGGTYAIYVSKVTNIGLGDYYIKLEALKKKLMELGMFDESYKKEIPKYATRIGVVTAKNGAAIKDIYKTIIDKNPYAEVILYPATVQGDSAFETIVNGIMTLDNMGLDVIIVGRGGGSIEDLYAFNDERVAYAIFNAKTPIISAVGHEINDSISDLVADVRVATPTAAGNLATFDYSEFESDIENYKLSLDDIIESRINDIRERIETKKSALQYLAPKAKLDRYKDAIKDKEDKIRYIMNNKMTDLKSTTLYYIEKLKSRNVFDKMKAGLGFITDSKGEKITTIKKVKVGNDLNVRLVDGSIKTKVLSIR